MVEKNRSRFWLRFFSTMFSTSAGWARLRGKKKLHYIWYLVLITIWNYVLLYLYMSYFTNKCQIECLDIIEH